MHQCFCMPLTRSQQVLKCPKLVARSCPSGTPSAWRWCTNLPQAHAAEMGSVHSAELCTCGRCGAWAMTVQAADTQTCLECTQRSGARRWSSLGSSSPITMSEFGVLSLLFAEGCYGLEAALAAARSKKPAQHVEALQQCKRSWVGVVEGLGLCCGRIGLVAH